MLDIKNVSVRRNDRQILSGIDWEVKPRENWALIGANGSGKTTLLKVVTGMMWRTSGEVTVLGEVLGRTDVRELRKRIGWVSNHLSEWIPPSEYVLEVVLSGISATLGFVYDIDDAKRKKARELLCSLDAEHIAHSTYGVISQGEKQKVLIARALMPDPEMLILDEPCSGLDIPSREYMLAVLESMPQKHPGITMILVTHHIEEVVPVFDKALVLKNGEVLAKGAKEEVLTGAILTTAFGTGLEVDNHGGRYWLRIAGRGKIPPAFPADALLPILQ
ncbi:MAG: ABC transporter ATP-binding protein [Planctomycetes bacterium]|nr:ABC transporter ATP-binding protein [Planctomycetota bacterium]